MTGTRGKSTVARLIASALREAGYRVLAKTTGSKPSVIFPEGSEEEIKRKGLPSILEGKRIIRTASSHQSRALVAELMSIQPECTSVESCRILRPHILVITNVRLDHTSQMGRSKPEIAQSLASAIPRRGTVFIPEEEDYQEFRKAIGKARAELISVPQRAQSDSDMTGRSLDEFEENKRLVLAVTDFLGIKKEIALRGMVKARPDFGSLKIWKADFGAPLRSLILVSAFASNDPESTSEVISRVKEKIPFAGKKLIGLLNFRKDRGDRSLQWLEALERGFFRDFNRLCFIGAHIHALRTRKKVRAISSPHVSVIEKKTPEAIMEKVATLETGEAILIGMGNMGGLGEELVRYWEDRGERYVC